MTLHHRDAIREQLEDSLFSRHAAAAALPKYRFPADEMASDAAEQLVADELLLDGISRQHLAPFSQT